MRTDKYRNKCILIALVLICLFSACGKTRETDNNKKRPDKNKEISKEFNSDESQDTSLGEFGIGILNSDEGTNVFVYQGEEIKIPFYVEGMGNDLVSEFGLILFTNGVPQPYKIEKNDGTLLEEKYMNLFSMKSGEREEFMLVFTPCSGGVGETVGFFASAVLKPSYIPENEENSNYGIYHSLNSILPQEIKIESDLENSFKSHIEKAFEEIPKEVEEGMDGVYAEGTFDTLDTQLYSELLDAKTGVVPINGKDNIAKMKLRLYGGIEGTYRTTIYVNHEPVKVMGADYIDTEVRKGKMSVVEFELDLSQYGDLNTIYAITMPVGFDYLLEMDFPVKTSSVLLRKE